jgi:hypothetical protein
MSDSDKTVGAKPASAGAGKKEEQKEPAGTTASTSKTTKTTTSNLKESGLEGGVHRSATGTSYFINGASKIESVEAPHPCDVTQWGNQFVVHVPFEVEDEVEVTVVGTDGKKNKLKVG